jgi:hypothetical protein
LQSGFPVHPMHPFRTVFHMKRTKVKVGISFDQEVLDEIDRHVSESPELAARRSELVNAIVALFLEGRPTKTDVRKVVHLKRSNLRGRHILALIEGDATKSELTPMSEKEASPSIGTD